MPVRLHVGGNFRFAKLEKDVQAAIKDRLVDKYPALKDDVEKFNEARKGMPEGMASLKLGGKPVTKELLESLKPAKRSEDKPKKAEIKEATTRLSAIKDLKTLKKVDKQIKEKKGKKLSKKKKVKKK